MSSRIHRVQQLLLLLVLCTAALLRFYHLDHSSLWSDEGNTWALLSRSFAQIARDAAADIHPPGYYWLLKLWTFLFGATAWGMRSFSALLGVILVYFVYRIGCLLQSMEPRIQRSGDDPHQSGTMRVLLRGPWNAAYAPLPLLAALLAALNPFQIYYSQEARMYMLLAVAGTGLIWSLLLYLHALAADKPKDGRPALAGYILFGVLGLWTHYSFPILLLAAGLGVLVGARYSLPRRGLVMFVLANSLIVICYLPWLPTALHRVLAWPAGGESVAWLTGVQLTLQTLVVGPGARLPEPWWLWLGGAALLPVVGVMALARRISARNGMAIVFVSTAVVLLWWLLPIGLMFGAGLFTDAFLKFLLTASPAWFLLIAAAPLLFSHRRIVLLGTLLVGTSGLLLAGLTLPSYYNSPTVRDNYAGVAAYVAAVADPEQDLVILDAPGQQEVWAYYDPGIPTLALPQSRPPDPEATLATLQRATAGRHNLYALFWATDEADPGRLVETWLDQHAFKGLESWQGNLRFVLYTLSDTMACFPLEPMVHWGESIRLREYCLSGEETTVRAGEVALVRLAWQIATPLTARYKVTVQVLNEHNQVIAQRDSEPVGGSRPTDSWQPDELIQDNHGVWIPVGTPPGIYRMILALYDASGTRLSVGDGDYWVLDEITISTPERPLPVSLLPVHHRLNRALGPVTFIGYNAHRLGMAHAPATALQPGDPVAFTFFWQAPTPLPAQWPDQLTATLTLGTQVVTFPLAGASYPTAAWQAGQILQYSVTVPFDGTDRYPRLQIGDQPIQLARLP